MGEKKEMIILGSGGFQTIPRPCCQCQICKEARKKGNPYTRNGPAVFVTGINYLIDTPKDIIASINRENIKEVSFVSYTHWHPDHTEGMRVFEEIKNNWSKKPPYVLKNYGVPVQLLVPPEIKKELDNIQSGIGNGFFDFYKKVGLLEDRIINFGETSCEDNVFITPIKLNQNKILTTAGYLIENNAKVLYMPCDVKPFDIEEKYLKGLDYFVVNCPYLQTKKGLNQINDDHPLIKELFSMDELVEIIKKYSIKNTIIVHIEEMWRLSFDEYKKLEEKYSDYGIKFAYDGMRIVI